MEEKKESLNHGFHEVRDAREDMRPGVQRKFAESDNFCQIIDYADNDGQGPSFRLPERFSPTRQLEEEVTSMTDVA